MVTDITPNLLPLGTEIHGDEVGTLKVPTLFKATRCVQNTAFGMLSTNCI